MGSRGFSLVEIIIAISVLGFISVGLVRMLESSSKSARSTERLVDLKFLARTFYENVECHRSLNSVPVGTAGFSPLSCDDFPMGSVTLRRKDNSKFLDSSGDRIGGFEVRAGCRSRRLHIEARKLDPMIQKLEWVDVFGGAGELCRHYFTTGSVCPGGQRVIGNAGAVPVCAPAVLDCPWYARTPVNTGGGCSESCFNQLLMAGAWVGLVAPTSGELETNTGSRDYYIRIRIRGAAIGCDPLRGTTYD